MRRPPPPLTPPKKATASPLPPPLLVCSALVAAHHKAKQIRSTRRLKVSHLAIGLVACADRNLCRAQLKVIINEIANKRHDDEIGGSSTGDDDDDDLVYIDQPPLHAATLARNGRHGAALNGAASRSPHKSPPGGSGEPLRNSPSLDLDAVYEKARCGPRSTLTADIMQDSIYVPSKATVEHALAARYRASPTKRLQSPLVVDVGGGGGGGGGSGSGGGCSPVCNGLCSPAASSPRIIGESRRSSSADVSPLQNRDLRFANRRELDDRHARNPSLLATISDSNSPQRAPFSVVPPNRLTNTRHTAEWRDSPTTRHASHPQPTTSMPSSARITSVKK